ncbi:hypothetical protein [Kaistia sp. MMO-174]|uniref:hypothetical protein n=1 Tax=Kaistia sp. MMO-174 TaxID=3081256 RepID=UPI003019B96C
MSTLVARLRERAVAARAEITATGLADALHFEEAANEIERRDAALRECQAVLAMIIAPKDIQQTTVVVAFAAATAAEAKARSFLTSEAR